MEPRRLEAGQHLAKAAVDADVLQKWPHQSGDGDRKQDCYYRTHQPAEPIALDRNEQIALDGVTEHNAENERRPRPLELLHNPAEQAEGEQRVEVAPLPRRLERADIDDAQYRRQD